MGSDVLILTIYFLVVIYVLYQMALSIESNLEDKVEIVLDQDKLVEQIHGQLKQQGKPNFITATVAELELAGKKLPPRLNLTFSGSGEKVTIGKGDDALEYFLEDTVMVSVLPMGKMTLNRSLGSLNINIKNSTSHRIYIDWDRSSVTTGMPRWTQRVIRSNIPITGTLSQPQVLSVIYPDGTFITQVTGETCIGHDPETQNLVPIMPLVEILEIAQLLKNRIEEFGEDASLPPVIAYTLILMIGIEQPNQKTIYLKLPFDFQAKLLAETIAFPPLRWLLSGPRPANARDALSTLLLGRPKL
ncbi:MAG: hypothetical protein AAFQ76_15045 [Cyanobacteria bacterium J06626_26]